MNAPMNASRLASVLQQRARRVLHVPGFRHAAVLVVLVQHPEPHVLLTVRGHDLPSHKGQISFPGGKLEPGEDAVAAALRETQEEIGLSPTALTLVGLLGDVWTPLRFLVTPVLATATDAKDLRINTGEVSELLRVPILELQAIAPRFDVPALPASVLAQLPPSLEAERQARGVRHYDWRSHDIWGMTAWVLAELLEVLEVEVLGPLEAATSV